MPKIEAWECASTGKLFKHETAYRKHLKMLSARRSAARKHKALVDSIEERTAELYTVGSFDQMCEWITENASLLALRQAVAFGKDKLYDFLISNLKTFGCSD